MEYIGEKREIFMHKNGNSNNKCLLSKQEVNSLRICCVFSVGHNGVCVCVSAEPCTWEHEIPSLLLSRRSELWPPSRIWICANCSSCEFPSLFTSPFPFMLIPPWRPNRSAHIFCLRASERAKNGFMWLSQQFNAKNRIMERTSESMFTRSPNGGLNDDSVANCRRLFVICETEDWLLVLLGASSLYMCSPRGWLDQTNYLPTFFHDKFSLRFSVLRHLMTWHCVFVLFIDETASRSYWNLLWNINQDVFSSTNSASFALSHSRSCHVIGWRPKQFTKKRSKLSHVKSDIAQRVVKTRTFSFYHVLRPSVKCDMCLSSLAWLRQRFYWIVLKNMRIWYDTAIIGWHEALTTTLIMAMITLVECRQLWVWHSDSLLLLLFISIKSSLARSQINWLKFSWRITRHVEQRESLPRWHNYMMEWDLMVLTLGAVLDSVNIHHNMCVSCAISLFFH